MAWPSPCRIRMFPSWCDVADALLDRLSLGALERAWRQVGRGRPPPDLGALWRRVRTGQYRPSRPWIRHIQKPNGNCRRLAVPSYLDRTLQRAILEVIPASVRRVRAQVHGYVRGRSPDTAVRCLVEQVGVRDWIEVVQLDISDLFDALEHDRLRQVLCDRWPDPCFVRLCMAWARAYGERGRGVGQGGPLSPLLANLYLERYLDPSTDFAADAGWIRYGDDVTAVTAHAGAALGVFAALELACHAAGLRVAMHKVMVCGAPTGGRLTVLGRVLAVTARGPRWQLVIRPSDRRS